MRRRAVLLALSASAWVGAAHASKDPYRLRVLKDQRGKETSLAAQAGGKHLVVVVMKGYWCRVCIAQLQRLAELEPRLRALGARFVGLNADAPSENQRMLEREGLECSVLSDEQHEVLSELGLWLPRAQRPLPALVVFDKCGDEAARWVGRHPGDRPERALMRLLQKLAETEHVCERPRA